jgi:type IV secretory pathway VirB10-like protein
MLGKLISLPLRVPVRSAQLLTHAAGRALSVTGQVVNAVTPGRAEPAQRDEAPSPAPAPPVADAPVPLVADAPVPPVADAPVPPVADAPTTAVAEAPVEWTEEPRAPLVEEPGHVSEEPELVEESAEPGAEDGAGARITVAEPWNGYGRMSAKDVIDRARTANVAELATMRLYEARHRARQTVLVAVDRQLKLANRGRSA